MSRLIFVIILVSSCLPQIHSYVLLQVRKQNENVSQIDALIHKLVPNEKVDELKVRVSQTNNKTKAGRKTASTGSKIQVTDDSSLESIVLSGVKNIIASEESPKLVDTISKKILDFVTKKAGPIFRAENAETEVIKPAVVHLGGDTPSILIEVKASTILNKIAEALKSKTVQSYVNHFTRRAAVAYRDLQELDKGKKKD